MTLPNEKQNSSIASLISEELSSYIKSSDLVFIDFYENWCGPCQRFMKIYPNLANEFDGKNIKFGKMDLQENSITKVEFSIHSIPTFILFKKGEPVERWTGIKTLLETKRIIEKYLEPNV